MRQRLKLSVVAAVVIALSAVGRSENRPDVAQADAAFEQLATLVTQKMAEYDIPGVAFGMVKKVR